MNEQKIREIANASSDYAESTVAYYDGFEDGLDYPAKMMKTRDLKFAELIVQECAKAIQEEKDTGLYTAHQSAGMTVSKAVIKDHFGIK